MENIKQIDIANSNLFELIKNRQKKSYKNINIYYIGYNTTKKCSNYENIHSVNPLH